MSGKYIIRKELKYLNSITFIEKGNFVPNWSRKKFDAFPFEKEFTAQRVVEELNEPKAKWEKLSRFSFKKENDSNFLKDRNNFKKLLGE